MDNLAIIKRIEIRLSEINMSKAEFYKISGISSASLSQWRTGVYSPTRKKLESAAECLGVSYEYLAYGDEETEKAPALTDKDERDIELDEFTYAMHNEAKHLPKEKQQVLLAMAKFMRQQNEKEG